MVKSPTGTYGESERRGADALAEVVVRVAQLLWDDDATYAAHAHICDCLFESGYDSFGAHPELEEVLVFSREGAALRLLPAKYTY